MKIGRKLTLSHILMALVPVALLAGALLYEFQHSMAVLNHAATVDGIDVAVEQASSALTDASLEKLGVVHDRKVQALEEIVAGMRKDAEYLSHSARTAEIFEGLKFYHDFGGLTEQNTLDVTSDSYASLDSDAQAFFGDFMKGKTYGELFLVCAAHGHVLYSYQKNSDLGQNVGEGPLRNEGLGSIWRAVNANQATSIVDYSPYTPAGGEQTAFLGTPCVNEDGDVYAQLILEVASDEIEDIINDRIGLGETGDSFLVGADADGGTSLRSNWRSMNQSIGDPKQGEFVARIMDGESGNGSKTRPDGNGILVCYSPVNLAGLQWGLVTTQDQQEALAAVDRMVDVQERIGAEIEETRASAIRNVQWISGIMLLFFVALAGGLAFAISRNITRPLVGAVQVADAVAMGDLTHRLESNATDEVGELARSLNTMTEGLRTKADLAAAIADGDLTCEIVPTSEHDEFGKALQRMVEQLAEVVGGIQTAAEQVSSGSKEIADSSSSLSQGATEQAAALEEISASMTELNGQVKTNAESAGQADQLSNVARETAVTGVDQMRTMTGAMNEISSSSEEIAKIIKVIDDIAFQTNLLALNAAVEAARAGSHGKGFAVVAEEVRNLAGRSAKAARESSQLIEGSLDKVRNGTEIANTTAASLESIVSSVTQASDLVGEIASASNEQAQGITEVSQGLSQIDSVTQQNTANSEETASAAQELSSQAATLQHLLSKFTLRDTGPVASTWDVEEQVYEPAGQGEESYDLPSPDAPAEDFAADRDVIELTSGWGD